MAAARRVSANPSNSPVIPVNGSAAAVLDPEDLYYDGSWPEEDGR